MGATAPQTKSVTFSSDPRHWADEVCELVTETLGIFGTQTRDTSTDTLDDSSAATQIS